MWVFITKLLAKTVERWSLAMYSQRPVASVAEFMHCGFTGAHTVFIEFSTNFKQGRGQIVFSIAA